MKKSALVLTAIIALTLVACGAPSSNTTQNVQIDATEFKFEPASIQVDVDKPVKLTFRNKGSIEHDWSIMKIPVANVKAASEDSDGHDMGGMTVDPELHLSAAAAHNSVIEFTPTRPGTYDIVCTVAGHKEAGMVGKLVVK